MGADEQCKVLCRVESLTEAQAQAFKVRIEEEYRVNMCASAPWFLCGCLASVHCSFVHMVATSSCCRILDNLPVAIAVMQDPMNPNDPEDQGVKTYERGFPVGYVAELEVRNVPEPAMIALLRSPPFHLHQPSRPRAVSCSGHVSCSVLQNHSTVGIQLFSCMAAICPVGSMFKAARDSECIAGGGCDTLIFCWYT